MIDTGTQYEYDEEPDPFWGPMNDSCACKVAAPAKRPRIHLSGAPACECGVPRVRSYAMHDGIRLGLAQPSCRACAIHEKSCADGKHA